MSFFARFSRMGGRCSSDSPSDADFARNHTLPVRDRLTPTKTPDPPNRGSMRVAEQGQGSLPVSHRRPPGASVRTQSRGSQRSKATHPPGREEPSQEAARDCQVILVSADSTVPPATARDGRQALTPTAWGQRRPCLIATAARPTVASGGPRSLISRKAVVNDPFYISTNGRCSTTAVRRYSSKTTRRWQRRFDCSCSDGCGR